MKTSPTNKTACRPDAPIRSFMRGFGDALSRKAWRLDSRDLCAQARQNTGLDDFGDPPIDPALTILATSLEREAGLHPLGRLLMRIHLHEILGVRLKLARQYKARFRDLAVLPTPPPIFITGMPRSGSTFLHELLVQDPALRAPRVWEVMSPVGAAGPDRGWRDSRVWRAAVCLWWFRRLAPKADSVYPMRARTPHECVAIHSYTFLSEEFISTCHIPAYEDFLRSADLRPAYTWQKCFLRLLQHSRPAARWVLKSPDHTHGLEALFSVFPDALIIHTHRNPLESLRSSIHLTEVLHGLYARPQDRNRLAEREAQNLAWGAERLVRFRNSHPELAKRFVDVNYSELAANPLRVARRIFRHIGMPLSASTVERMRRLARRRSAYKGRHDAPTLAEVGLDSRAELRRFSGYCHQFGIPGASAAVYGRQR